MYYVTDYLENSPLFTDAATLRTTLNMSKTTLQRKLDELEKDFTIVIYGNRKLYSVSIIPALQTSITMKTQKDTTTKNKERMN